MNKRVRSQQKTAVSPPPKSSTNHPTKTQHSAPIAALIQRAEIDPHSLTTQEQQQLQRAIGNQAVGQLLSEQSPGTGPDEYAQSAQQSLQQMQASRAGDIQRTPIPTIQLKLENTSYNNLVALGPYKGAVETYAKDLSDAVESARDMIATKYFVHIPAVDGYMQKFLDNFDTGTNKFIDGAAMPRQAGYWIESYVTKVIAPSASGLDVVLQAKRGNSRPDVVLQYKGTDLAWLDITSGVSEGHIFDKDSDGWLGTPYVTEVTYDGLKLNELNTVAVPDKSTKDISGLLERAKEAYAKQMLWEARVLEKHGLNFGTLMHNVYYYVKESAVKHEEENDLSETSMDAFYSPDMPGNKYEKLAVSFIADKVGKEPDPRELAAVLMYWQNMISRYEKQFQNKLPPQYHVPGKEQLGLSWVNDASSSDGEPLVRDWFPV